MDYKIIFITGPTASGKTHFAMSLAKKLEKVAILNADSLQWYEDLQILTAQPSKKDKDMVPHFMFGTKPMDFKSSVARFQSEALTHLQILISQDYTILIVGGTGLYLQSLIKGISFIPDIPNSIRLDVQNLARTLSIDDFKAYVLAKDPLLKVNNPPSDIHRLSRALEVVLTTGQSIRTFQGQAVPPLSLEKNPFYVLLPDQQTLINNIEKRFHQMIDAGVLEEIQTFWKKNPPNDASICQAVGLNPLTQYINGLCSFETARDLVITKTKQYAKRQRTWIQGQSPQNRQINPSIDQVLSCLGKS